MRNEIGTGQDRQDVSPGLRERQVEQALMKAA